MSILDWVPGNLLDLKIPAHGEVLRSGGKDFLTEAFRASGALAADNRVTRIIQFEECPGGSTGRKFLLSVEYEKPAANLPTSLFVKFSRDFDDPLRDRGKFQMESEVRFALLSRIPNFPIEVPMCLYADYDPKTGTGILISQRISFGVDGIECHYNKCLDYEMPAPLEHYKALIRVLARLAGTHKAGRLPDSVKRQFPFNMDDLTVASKAPYSQAQLQARVARYAEFTVRCPQLVPENIASPQFLANTGFR